MSSSLLPSFLSFLGSSTSYSKTLSWLYHPCIFSFRACRFSHWQVDEQNDLLYAIHASRRVRLGNSSCSCVLDSDHTWVEACSCCHEQIEMIVPQTKRLLIINVTARQTPRAHSPATARTPCICVCENVHTPRMRTHAPYHAHTGCWSRSNNVSMPNLSTVEDHAATLQSLTSCSPMWVLFKQLGCAFTHKPHKQW